MRPHSLLDLLNSVEQQTLYPDEIIIIDGSLNNETAVMLRTHQFVNLQYFLVGPDDRGLTKQRNYGIRKVDNATEVVCFLDDDTVLEQDYFEQLINTYSIYPECLGVGGYIANESDCEYVGPDYKPGIDEYFYDGWKRKDGSRFILRKKLGLDSDCAPGFSPDFSHGRSVGFLPPSGKTYAVEQLMGGVSSFRKIIFKTILFSTYFVGYGLYEDADFSLRVAKTGKLYLNTGARLNHYHEESGRPSKYNYGKMVVRNGWYVWRVKNPNPTLKVKLKWNAITLLLLLIRFTNVISDSNRKAALTEALGRTVGWFSLFFKKPKLTDSQQY